MRIQFLCPWMEIYTETLPKQQASFILPGGKNPSDSYNRSEIFCTVLQTEADTHCFRGKMQWAFPESFSPYPQIHPSKFTVLPFPVSVSTPPPTGREERSPFLCLLLVYHKTPSGFSSHGPKGGRGNVRGKTSPRHSSVALDLYSCCFFPSHPGGVRRESSHFKDKTWCLMQRQRCGPTVAIFFCFLLLLLKSSHSFCQLANEAVIITEEN